MDSIKINNYKLTWADTSIIQSRKMQMKVFAMIFKCLPNTNLSRVWLIVRNRFVVGSVFMRLSPSLFFFVVRLRHSNSLLHVTSPHVISNCCSCYCRLSEQFGSFHLNRELFDFNYWFHWSLNTEIETIKILNKQQPHCKQIHIAQNVFTVEGDICIRSIEIRI